jgi:hypothetical protein
MSMDCNKRLEHYYFSLKTVSTLIDNAAKQQKSILISSNIMLFAIIGLKNYLNAIYMRVEDKSIDFFVL